MFRNELWTVSISLSINDIGGYKLSESYECFEKSSRLYLENVINSDSPPHPPLRRCSTYLDRPLFDNSFHQWPFGTDHLCCVFLSAYLINALPNLLCALSHLITIVYKFIKLLITTYSNPWLCQLLPTLEI